MNSGGGGNVSSSAEQYLELAFAGAGVPSGISSSSLVAASVVERRLRSDRAASSIGDWIAGMEYPREAVHRRRAAPAGAAFHEPRPARVLRRRPARGREGSAVRALLALPRARCGGCTWTSSPKARVSASAATRRRLAAGRRVFRSRTGRAPCTSGCSWSSATTPSPSSAARTSPASGPRTCSRRSFSAAGWPPISSSPRATSPTTAGCRAAATATTGTSGWERPTRRRWSASSTSTPTGLERRAGVGGRAAIRAATSPRRRGERSIKAKALDAMRGLLPAASLSHVGVYATRPGLRAAA